MLKINDSTTFWHRTGDVGWVDKKGRIWSCGRKSHRVTVKQGILFTIPCEAICNEHPLVKKSALVGVNNKAYQVPVMCVELLKRIRKRDKQHHGEKIINYLQQNVITRDIETILFYKGHLPVDIRHNSKIDRLHVKQWASRLIAS